MCGIAGFVSLSGLPLARGTASLDAMGRLIAIAGLTGFGRWSDEHQRAGLVHRRLAIIDLAPAGAQPMHGPNGTVISYNGEIYNYIELREELSGGWKFRSTSDTEVILAAYERWGEDCVEHLRGMFAFAIWDEPQQIAVRRARPVRHQAILLHACREAFSISRPKPRRCCRSCRRSTPTPSARRVSDVPVHDRREDALQGLSTSCCRDTSLRVENGHFRHGATGMSNIEVDFDHSLGYFERRLPSCSDDSMLVHLRSDVPVGGYVSGGLDSSLIGAPGRQRRPSHRDAFHGRFTRISRLRRKPLRAGGRRAARYVAARRSTLPPTTFATHIGDVIYHLDFPVAGPGSFPQYMVSAARREASQGRAGRAGR